MSFSKRLLSGDAPAVVPGENFKVVTYTGNGGTQAITGVGFKPDFVWCKRRNEGSDHNLSDSTRGVMTGLNINSNAQEGDQDPLGVTVFGDDGFTVSDNDGGGASVNGTNDTYVAWCWKAAGGTTSSNTDGSTTSTVQANKAAGFSIVTYTGTGSNASVGHGLGAPAKFIMIKKRSGASDWAAFTAIDNTKYLEPNGTPPFRTANVWQNTDPTSTVFTLTTGGDTNGGSATFVAYCFADVEGYQKFGSYDGNGSTNGPIVNVGFEPAFVMVKNLDSTEQWLILDNKRNTANPRNNLLQMNLSNAESTEAGAAMNFYSNGFQSVGTGGGGGSGQINSNGDKYLYWAIAADPPAETPTLTSSFNIETYTGTGAARSITGLGFSPGFVWSKDRENSEQHQLHDIVRGATKALASNITNAEATRADGLTSFDSDGFSLGSDGAGIINDSSRGPYVAWTWKAGDIEPTINTNGSLTSFVSANDNAGFSVVSYTGDGNSARTVGHGLSAKCDLVIIKGRDSADKWPVQLPQLGDNARMVLEANAAKTDDSTTAQAGNATVFGIGGDNAVNKSGDKFIAYCFRNITGYQKIGTYTGNGSTQSITGLGFKPDFLIIKQTNATNHWRIFDSKRGLGNPQTLFASLDSVEDNESNTVSSFDSDGWTMGSQQGVNDNGDTYLYWAVAKNVPSNTTLANSFKTVTYTGNGGTQSITGTGFKPDLVWMKQRSGTQDQMWYDNNRGAGHYISSNNTNAQGYANSTVTSFDSDGFSVGSSNSENQNSQTFVAWAWKAGNTWQSNVDGSSASTVNVNTANGFSIVKYIGNQTAGHTIGHGLGAVPEVIILKCLDSTNPWYVYHVGVDASNPANYNLRLNGTDARQDSTTEFNDTAPTSSVFTLGTTTGTNKTDNEYIAYCWTPKSGFSKFGSYTGNGNANNAITGLGFEPDWLMIKNTTDAGNDWQIYDSVRTEGQVLLANSNNADADNSSNFGQFDSNGFTVQSNNDGNNKSGSTYIYMAFKMN